MTAIAHQLRRVFIALLIAVTAAGSASAGARAMSADCVTVADLHAAHMEAAQDQGTGADGETGPVELNHTCLHCSPHGCAAVLTVASGSQTKTNLWPANTASVSEQVVIGQRPGTLQRPPKA
ncbi:hypothetical protein DEA8626_01782 [Defluviimonas aquaemixtae]|uniref:DUF2946 domain-containing protein n=1 Tax=Albidovulum aquaemixtae TaxID=1542388 RepID=A0A2R8B6U2_9RHOB|nr:hypothetical protein [Defluviimonas aquaemixtae]SPH18250.1 hypothetical protein DEA8626_01782 [Defluviimonas aquaemixtae]